MDRKDCPGCGGRKPIGEFNWKCKRLGVRQTRCRGCTRAQVQDHYRRHRHTYIQKALHRNKRVLEEHQLRLLAYLSAHPCVDCGEGDPVCLEFDHVRGDKIDEIGRMLGDRPWRVIEAEIAKCDVRCANCHRRRTAHSNGWYRTLWSRAG